MIAIGPIFAVIVVGFFVSWSLSALDEHFGITTRVIAGIDELSDGISSVIENKKRAINKLGRDARDSVIDYTVVSDRRTMVRLMNNYLHKFIQSSPRFY